MSALQPSGRNLSGPFLKGRGTLGFTLVEMTVVLAIVAIMLALLLPAMARSKGRAREVFCQQNQRQVYVSWRLYGDDHEDWLPAVKPGSYAGPDRWISGWLSMSSSGDNTNTLFLTDTAYAQIGSYVDNPATFRCPADRSTVSIRGRTLPRVRSISMNCWLNYQGDKYIGEDRFRVFRKYTDIHDPSPSRLWVFIDEREDSINDGMFETNLRATGKLAKLVDYPAGFHNRAGGITFADGHGEIKHWSDDRTIPALTARQIVQLDVPSPDNPDVAWLQNHSSSPRAVTLRRVE